MRAHIFIGDELGKSTFFVSWWDRLRSAAGPTGTEQFRSPDERDGEQNAYQSATGAG